MENRQAINLFITHVDKEGPFLKVWGQTEKSNSLYVEQFLLGAAQQFEQGIGKLQVPNLQVGTVVCAKYKDNKYYRAKITSVEYLNECFVEVFFLDYGNKDVVPSDNVRTFDHFPPNFINIPPLAAAFIFAETHCPGGGEWTNQIFDTISKELKYREVQCVLLAQAAQYYLVKLFVSGTDLGSIFIGRGLMQPIPQPSQQAVLLSMKLQKQPQAPVVTPSPEINTYKACTLEPGQQYAVYVSFVHDGPTHFSVQLQQSEHILIKLMKEINEVNLRMLEDIPLPGTICLARCQEDGNICRAVVTNEVDNQFKVFYVDFGNYETLSLEHLYEIPFKYVLPKVMAIRLALNGIEKSSVTLDMLLAFKKFVDNRLLHMKVLPSFKKTVIPKCELWDPETKVSALEVINRAALHSYPEPLSLNRGFTQLVRVSYVFSCNRFFVQLVTKEAELVKLMEELQVSCQSNENIDVGEIKIGLPCCALFESDQQWYRSEIVDVIDRDNVKVRYIDYGNEEVVPVGFLKAIEGELLTVLRPQAIECCLNGYQNMGPDEERDSFLEELVLEQQFTMKVNEMLGKKALVELIDASEYNVASLLLDKLASAKSQVSPLLVQAGNRIEHRKTDQRNENFRNDRRPPRDNQGLKDRHFERTNDKPWRQDRYEGNEDRHETDDRSWRQNKGPGRNNDRDNDKFNNKDNKFHNRRENNHWNDQPANDSWGNTRETNSNNWETTSPTQNFKKPRDGFRQPRPKHDNDRDDYQKKDNFRRKDFRKDGSEISSSGSEKSFNRGLRTSSRNDRGGGGHFKERDNKFRDSSFASSSVVEDSWNVSPVCTAIDAAPTTAIYAELDVVGTEGAVVISWFHNPSHFYCQLKDSQADFKTLMEEIQQFYKGRKPENCVAGPVIGQFPEDNVLYRAQILEHLGNSYKVFYVDFGNVSTITKVWPLEKKFMTMPAQAIRCGISGLAPNGDKWPESTNFGRYFEKESFTARFLHKDETTAYVQLFDEQIEIAQLLIQDGLAVSQLDLNSKVDIPILLGQQFRVILKSVNNLNDIIVALECGLALSCKMHNLEFASEIYEDVLKVHIEQTLIVYVDNVLDNNILDVTFYDNDGNKLVIIVPDEGALDTVEPLCPLPLLTPHLAGYVSHADETSVFIQPAEYADQLGALLEKMFEIYDSVTPENQIIPEEDMLYAVHSEDTNWYRGRVTAFDDDCIKVCYVDYGNSEQIKLGELRELHQDFMVPHMLCIQVRVTSGSAQSFLEKDVIARISYGETGWEGVIEENPAGPKLNSQDQTYVEPLPEVTENLPPLNNEPINNPNVDEIPSNPTETDKQIGISVEISHIDSPTEFYVQFTESTSDVANLQQTLQNLAPELPVLENITVGVLCAAPYSVDRQWYRAEVLDADDDITTVRFVDYGNTDVIDNKTTRIKTLPPNLLSLAVYATRCSLKVKPIEEEWSQTALEYFENVASSETMSAEFIMQDEKCNYVELYANGRNVRELLIEDNMAVPCEIVTESKATCFVSHLNSPSEFWVQMENCVDELEWIAEQLSSAEKFPELDDMTPGTLCAALFPDDEMWYRARILSNTVAGIELLFIDYGNSCISTSLRQLPEDLLVTPPLAQKCCLQKPDGIPYWTQEVQEKFTELSADGQTIFAVKKITTGETAVVELLLNGENIVGKILPVTENGYVRNFESLNRFNIEKNGELLPEFFGLEPMPGFVWNDEANAKFKQLYPEGTLFQIEIISEENLRLYYNQCDVRPDLGGSRNLNLSNAQDEDKKEENKPTTTENCDNLVDKDITPDSGTHSDSKTSQESEEMNESAEENVKNVEIKTDEESESNNEETTVNKSGPEEEFSTVEEDNSVTNEKTVISVNGVEENSSKTNNESQLDHPVPSEKNSDKTTEMINNSINVMSDNETLHKIEDSEVDKSVPSEKTNLKDKDSPKEEKGFEEKSEEKIPSRPPSRLSHDERIVPGVVSRPQTPITVEEQENI